MNENLEEKYFFQTQKSDYESILNNDCITHCYISKQGCYYRDNYCGYTENKAFAGIYPKIEAIKYGIDSLVIRIIPINNIEHNQFINSKIDELKKHII